VREFRTLGSARGAARKGGPYRNSPSLLVRLERNLRRSSFYTADRTPPLGPSSGATAEAHAGLRATGLTPPTATFSGPDDVLTAGGQSWILLDLFSLLAPTLHQVAEASSRARRLQLCLWRT
jgi:hypothetical protein